MLRKFLYREAFRRVDKNMLNYYSIFNDQHSWPLEKLEEQNDQALQRVIEHAFKNVPYYKDLSCKLKLTHHDIQTRADLAKLPILTKAIIKENPERFVWKEIPSSAVKKGKTGGSSGDPLNFIMSPECYYRGFALNLRTFHKAGYSPGDRLIVMGGGSLVGPSSYRSKITNYLLNQKTFSSYGFSKEKFCELINLIRKQKRIYIKGYASSLFLLSKFMDDHNISLYQEGGLFPTSEKLMDSYRFTIQNAFPNCVIYDNYGLNDGGISATECYLNEGFHVNYGRSLLEVTDDNGLPVTGKIGRILATSLYNYAQPFLRYDTGDYGELSYDPCQCGLHTPRIINLQGRETDYLEIDGHVVASPVLTVLFGKIPELSIYKIIQKDSYNVEFRMCIADKSQHNNDELKSRIIKTIEESFKDKIPSATLSFKFFNTELEVFEGSNKHKFIINETLQR